MNMRFSTQNPAWVKTTQTHEWWKAFTLTPEEELVKMALTSFLDKTFYENLWDVFQRISSYTMAVDPDFLLKLAIRWRQDGLRTVNQVFAVEAMKSKYFENWLRLFCQRPDDLIEIVWYYAIKFWFTFKNIKLANKLKKAIACTLPKFSLYQLEKYKNKWDWINLYDLVNMTHPKVEQNSPIDKFMRWEITVEEKENNITREKKISTEGNKEENRVELMAKKKLDALATIRNLANMKRAWVSSNTIIEYLKWISRRKIFPYQALQAIDVMIREWLVQDSHKLVWEIIEKLVESFKNITDNYKWKIAIWVDCSGSMNSSINQMSELGRKEVARYYGLLMQEAFDNADIYARANMCSEWYAKWQLWVRDGIRDRVWWWTEMNCFFNEIKWKWYDYAIVITDEQIADYWIPNAKSVVSNSITIRNIADYENTIVNKYEKWYTYFTWLNDKMRKIAKNLNNLQDVVAEIKKIDLDTAFKEGK